MNFQKFSNYTKANLKFLFHSKKHFTKLSEKKNMKFHRIDILNFQKFSNYTKANLKFLFHSKKHFTKFSEKKYEIS